MVNASQPTCSTDGGCNQGAIDSVLEANSTLVEQLLECFLVDPNCTLFQQVLTKQLAKNHLHQSKPHNKHNHVSLYTCGGNIG